MTANSPAESYRFHLDAVDPELKPEDIQQILEESTREALASIKSEPDAVHVDLEGGFLDIGTISVLLVIKSTAALAGGAFVAGAGKKAGEFFFEEYLAPRLRRKNVIPSEFSEQSDPPIEEQEKS